ncbi:MAG: glycerol-3-phosphate 1-O-acyltransferase PlsY [Oscillospiraceae bacterium]|nr:glycerol-3-phosphate 1-O-acyltransferase PlsY [Oscillospiraceae bacterium]
MSDFLVFAITLIQAYIIGGINGAIITSKNLYKRDIREFGSGNPGTTNFYRTFGMRGTLLVVVIDVVKTAAPIFIGWGLYALFGNSDATRIGMTGRIVAGLGVILGHCFPIYYKFRGGKAVLALGTLLFTIDWRVSVVGWGLFLIFVLTTRYVSLGAIIGSLGYPIALLYLRLRADVAATTFDFWIAALSAVIVIARHHANIGRLLHGNERKFSFRRSKPQPESEEIMK